MGHQKWDIRKETVGFPTWAPDRPSSARGQRRSTAHRFRPQRCIHIHYMVSLWRCVHGQQPDALPPAHRDLAVGSCMYCTYLTLGKSSHRRSHSAFIPPSIHPSIHLSILHRFEAHPGYRYFRLVSTARVLDAAHCITAAGR